jgi:hypothetical protein
VALVARLAAAEVDALGDLQTLPVTLPVRSAPAVHDAMASIAAVGEFGTPTKITAIMPNAKFNILLRHVVSVDQYLSNLIAGFEIFAFVRVVALQQKFAVASFDDGS